MPFKHASWVFVIASYFVLHVSASEKCCLERFSGSKTGVSMRKQCHDNIIPPRNILKSDRVTWHQRHFRCICQQLSMGSMHKNDSLFSTRVHIMQNVRTQGITEVNRVQCHPLLVLRGWKPGWKYFFQGFLLHKQTFIKRYYRISFRSKVGCTRLNVEYKA